MIHDPMCNPRSRDYRGNYVPCECDLIARVREDERQRCREAVAASECWCGCDSSTALAAIDGLVKP